MTCRTGRIHTITRPLLLAGLVCAAVISPCSAGAAVAGQPLVFEAERYTAPQSAWRTNQFSDNKWNLWSTDKDAAKKWSGGVVLQSPVVQRDRATPEEGAPPLHTRLTDIPNGTYAVELRGVGRPLAVSLDGKTWLRKQGSDNRLGIVTITDGTFELWVDDRYAANPPGSSYYDALAFTRAAPVTMGISNGDFEADGTQPVGWQFTSREASGSAEPASDAQSGRRAARIRNEGEGNWTLSNLGRLDVKPGQVFTVTAWFKGEGMLEMVVSGFAGGQPLARSLGGDLLRASSKWEQLAAEVRVPEGCDQLNVRLAGRGKTDLLVDSVAIRAGAAPRPVKLPVQGFARQRIREKLDRGLIAMPVAGNQVYVGWRLLDSDAKDTTFNVYRRAGQAAPVKLNGTPVGKTTDFVDANPPAGPLQYSIRPVTMGKEGAASEVAVATPSAEGQSFVRLKLAGDYTFQKAGIADLDGDGRYDFVLKQPNANVDPYVNYWKRSPGTFQLEAYRHDGKLLWRHDLGWSIEQGIWYSPYVVYDFDGDGKAEVAVKTGEGDPRDADGRVMSGPEWLSILDGLTGKERTRVAWPSRDRFPDYNYYCRNQLGIAYLDGKTPCLIVERGTYNTIKVAAYEYRQGKLRELWNWNDREGGPKYRGQGAHILRAADVDGDGRDEVILGSAVLDDNGVGLWSTGMGHPDHLTVGDLDPARPGLEIQYGMETRQQTNSICMVEAKTGRILWGLKEPTKHVHSSGLCADIDPTHPGVESYGGERDFKDKRWLFSTRGDLLSTADMGGLAPRAAYWDADLTRELVMGSKLSKFRGAELPTRIEGAVVAVADILGDWREEIITTVAGELRIYTTTIPALDRRVCLMRDPIYRLDVAGAAQGYMQIPGLSALPSAGR